MEISTLLLIVAVIACPLTMGAMMWMMNRKMNERSGDATSQAPSAAARLAELKSMEESVRAEIQKLDKVAESESRDQHSLPGAPMKSASTAGTDVERAV